MSLRKRCKAVLLVLIILIVTYPEVDSIAGKTTQQQLDDAEDARDEIEDNLNDKKDEIDGLNTEISSLQTKLNDLNDQLAQVSDKLEDLEGQIQDKEDQIAVTTANLNEAEDKKQKQYDDMKARIQFIYERGDTVYLEVLFDASSFSDFLTRAEYISRLEEYDRDMLDQYQETCEAIEETKRILEEEAKELASLKAEAQEQQDKIEEIIASTSNYVVVYQDQVSEAERLAEAYEADLKAKEADIKTLKAKLAEEKRLAALAAAATVRDISNISFEEGDRYLLANLIYCEAGGEIYAGKLAVGAVVINRLLNGAFPDTIVGVIYQKNQFSPAASGRLALALAQNKANAACYKAADEAMAGSTNVGGCLFFRTPVDYVTPTYVIGGHIFY